MSETSAAKTTPLLLPSAAERVVLPRMASTRLVPLGSQLILHLIRLLSGSGCRFYPTCSEYARLAIAHHGALRGSKMTLLRLCRCHPFHPGGYDPPHR